MFGHNRNSGIHTLSNYNEAHHAWETTKPIRGRKEEIRPLGHRRNVDQYQIRKNGDVIECVLYKTPVVSYLPDGRIVLKDDGWKSVSTAYFIEEVLGIRARIFNKELNVSFGGGEYPVLDNGFQIAWVNGNLTPLNPTAIKVHGIDRKKTNNVRAKYKDFTTYMSGMLKLRAGGVVTSEELKVSGVSDRALDLDREYSQKFPEYVQAFFGLVNDTNPDSQTASWYQATLALARSFGRWSYKADGIAISSDHSKLMRKFDELVIGFNRDECLASRELSLGEVKRDSYAKYFSSGWKRLHSQA